VDDGEIVRFIGWRRRLAAENGADVWTDWHATKPRGFERISVGFARWNDKGSAKMKAVIKAIIFDFGGVLVEWHPHNLYKACFPEDPQGIDEFLDEVGFYAWNAEQDKGRSFAEGVALLSAKFPHRTNLIEAYAENWIDSIDGEITGTVEILHRLRAKNYPLYGLSNWSAETFPLVRDEFSFLGEFDDVVLSGEVKMAKPEPEIFELLLKRIVYSAEECFFIDDSQANIDVARILGFQTHHFKSPEILEEALKVLGVL